MARLKISEDLSQQIVGVGLRSNLKVNHTNKMQSQLYSNKFTYKGLLGGVGGGEGETPNKTLEMMGDPGFRVGKFWRSGKGLFSNKKKGWIDDDDRDAQYTYP